MAERNRVTPTGEIVAGAAAGAVPRQPGQHPPRPRDRPPVAGAPVDHLRAHLQGLAGADVGARPVDAAVLLGRGGGAGGGAPPVRPVPPRRLRPLDRCLGGGPRRAAPGRPDGPAPPRRAGRRAGQADARPGVVDAAGRSLRRRRRRAGAGPGGPARPVVARGGRPTAGRSRARAEAPRRSSRRRPRWPCWPAATRAVLHPSAGIGQGWDGDGVRRPAPRRSARPGSTTTSPRRARTSG